MCYLECKDTVEVVALDEDEGNVAVLDDGRRAPLLLPLHHQGHELVNHRHVNVTPVIATYQHLEAKQPVWRSQWSYTNVSGGQSVVIYQCQ